MLAYKREIGTSHQIFVIVKNAYFYQTDSLCYIIVEFNASSENFRIIYFIRMVAAIIYLMHCYERFLELPTGWNYVILGIVSPKTIIFLIVLTDQFTYCRLFSVYQEVGNQFSNATHWKDIQICLMIFLFRPI